MALQAVLSKNQAALYIDGNSVCAMSLQLVGGSVKIAGQAEIFGPNNFEPTAQNNQLLLEKIKKVVEQAGIRTRSINLVVPPDASMIRHFEIPQMPKKDEKNAVRFEAQKYVPLDIRDLYFDHESYTDSARKKLSVVFFACKKQWVDQVASLLVLMGMRLGCVELAAQSVARGFRKKTGMTPTHTEALVLPSDNANAELVFFKEKTVLLTRHLSLTQQMNVAPEPAFLASELRLSLDYFRESYKNESISKLHWLGGEGESAQLLGDALSRDVAMPVESSDYLRSIGNGHAATAPLAAAYGCALGSLQPEKGKRINLAPTEAVNIAPPTHWADEQKELKDLGAKISVVVVTIFLVLYVVSVNVIGAKRSVFNKAMEAYPKAANGTIDQPLTVLEGAYAAVNDKAIFAANVVDKRPYLTTKFDRLASLVPWYIRLTKMHYTDDTNGITGTSDILLRLEGYIAGGQPGGELTALNKFVNQLAEDEDFMNGFDAIEISSTKKTIVNENPTTKFALDCLARRKA